MFIKKIFYLFTFLISLLINNSCAQTSSSQEVLYFSYSEFAGIDSIKTKVDQKLFSDNIVKIRIRRLSNSNNEAEESHYILSKDSTINNTKFISERIFYIEKESYKVMKFIYNDPNSQDEEEMYFYSSGLGIIIKKNLSWGGYQRIAKMSNNKEKTQRAIILANKILQDNDFWNLWKE